MSETVIRESGRWTLTRRDGNLEARRPIDYDGVLYYSTENRPNSYRKNSRFNLTEREVVKEFVRNARPGETISELLEECA